MMDLKIEHDFLFKKDSIKCMLTNFCAFAIRCFILKPCVTHFNTTTYSKTCGEILQIIIKAMLLKNTI